MAKLYYLSRFPRFMANQWALYACEPGYILHDIEGLRERIKTVPNLDGAPRCYEDFANAARNAAGQWPCLYVHRVNPKAGGSKPGDMLSAYHAREGAQFVGNIVQVRELLDAGDTLNRFRRISVGGNNRYEVPFPVV